MFSQFFGKSHQPLVAGWSKMATWLYTFPPFLRGRVYPFPYPLPGVQGGGSCLGWGFLLRLFGHLGDLLFFITFSMPSWIDFCLIFDRNLPPKIHRNRSKIDGKPINLLVKYPDSNGQEVKFSDSNDLLKHALASSKPSQSFVDELFKHLAKQAPYGYVDLKTKNLSEMLKNNNISIQELYMQLCFQGACDGFVFAN